MDLLLMSRFCWILTFLLDSHVSAGFSRFCSIATFLLKTAVFNLLCGYRIILGIIYPLEMLFLVFVVVVFPHIILIY